MNNFIDVIDADSTRWTRDFAEEMYEKNKDWCFSPAGALGWRMPVSEEFSQIVQLNWKVQNQLIQLVHSLERFQDSAGSEDWLRVEKDLDSIRCTIATMKRFTDENLKLQIELSSRDEMVQESAGMAVA